MKTKTLLTALLLVILIAAARAQPSSSDKKPESPSAVKPDPKLEQLIEQLGDVDFRKRDLAANLLKAEGVKALPTLRAALKHPDAEVRRRLVELIPGIETAAILAPKRVTLKMKDKTLNEIFAELTRQTDYKFQFYHNNPNAKFSFEFSNLTFWEAIDQISKNTGLNLQQGWGDEQVRFNYLGEGHTSAPYTCTDGAFRLTATGFQLYKHVDLTQSGRGTVPRSESLTFTFSIQSEPKLPILGLGQPRLTAAFDTEKNSLLLPANPNEFNEWGGGGRHFSSRYGNGNRMWYQQSQVQLTRVSEKATAVKVLRGSLPITLLSEQKPHVIAEKIQEAKGKKATVGTTTLHVEEVKAIPNQNQFEVRITFNEDTGGNPNDYSWQNSIYQRLEVQDAKGNKYQLYNTNWGNSNGTSLQMTMTYGPQDLTKKPQGDVKLVFQEWKVMHHQLEFEFKDLPLP